MENNVENWRKVFLIRNLNTTIQGFKAILVEIEDNARRGNHFLDLRNFVETIQEIGDFNWDIDEISKKLYSSLFKEGFNHKWNYFRVVLKTVLSQHFSERIVEAILYSELMLEDIVKLMEE